MVNMLLCCVCKFGYNEVRASPATNLSTHHWLSAANGSSIGIFGTRSVNACFYGHTFNWDFVIASIVVAITGAEFLCANGLLVDFSNRHLSDAVFCYFSVSDRGLWAPTFANFSALDNDFQHLPADFAWTATPAFSVAVDKHSVQHFIPTTG